MNNDSFLDKIFGLIIRYQFNFLQSEEDDNFTRGVIWPGVSFWLQRRSGSVSQGILASIRRKLRLFAK